MTKEKIKELLQGVYSGWKNIDDVVNEIHDTLSSVTLPPIEQEETDNKTLD